VATSSKNIVICCDGTGQSIRAAQSVKPHRVVRTHVLRMFDLLERDTADQVSCYDPGIGTIPGLEGEIGSIRTLKNVRDEWLGTGLMSNLAEMYIYLMEHHEPGDRVFLFGFSRGAFTVRALAGMIRCVGLLRKGHLNLLPWVRDVYENMAARHRKAGRRDDESNDELAREFRHFTRPDEIRIAFLGVWDTVKAYGYLRPKGLPHVRNNELVDVVRHAMAIDERRSPFQPTGWGDRVLRQDPAVHRDMIDHRIQEVWFAGDHSDVGGGHADNRTDFFSRASFDWMVGEAVREGLRISPGRYPDVTGWAPNSEFPSNGLPHDLSRVGFGRAWWIWPRLELDNSHFPPARNFRCFVHTGDRRLLDHTFPDKVWRDSQRLAGRPVDPAIPFLRIHESVRRRFDRGDYAPKNLCAALGAAQKNEITILWTKTRVRDQCDPGPRRAETSGFSVGN
jgi:uncharacterized protein (DUF2235 family)